MFYAVVEFMTTKFNSNKELSVVPIIWLIKEDRKCYWPTKTNKLPINEFIKSCPPPKKSWPRYEVFKVHLKTENYEFAERELDKLISEYTEMANFSGNSVAKKSVISDFESSDEDSDNDSELLIKRKKFSSSSTPNNRNIPNKNGYIQNVDQNLIMGNNHNLIPTANLTPTSTSTSTMTIEALNENILIDNGTSYSVLGGSNTNTRNLNNCEYVLTTCSANSTNLDLQQTVLSSLANIQSTQEQILLTMQEILRFNKKIAMEKLIAPENLPSFPIQCFEYFLTFENLLKEDPIVNQYMVRRLASLGGSGVEGVTRRIMKFLLTNHLGNQFNWKGRHNKIAFEKTTTMTIVYEAAKLNFPTQEQNDMRIAWSVKEWLKHSVTRIKQGNKKN